MIIISSITKLVVHEFFHHIESPLAIGQLATNLVNIVEEHLAHLVDWHRCIDWAVETLQ